MAGQAEGAEILFIVFSPERGENTIHPRKDGIYASSNKPFPEMTLVTPGQGGQKQHMVFNIVDIFIRIPLLSRSEPSRSKTQEF